MIQEHRYESAHDTYSSVSAEASVSYGGLFYSGSASGGFEKKTGNSQMTKEGSELKISFKVRKVAINRPWLNPGLLQYPTLGIKGFEAGAWSSGDLDVKENKGQFPLLPTAIICAKDVEISSNAFSDTAEKSFSEMKSNASFKVRGRHSL